MDLVRSSLTRAQRSTQRKRRRAKRRKRRSEKRACSDTMATCHPRHPKPTHGRSALGITKSHHPDPTNTSRPTLPFIITLLPSACTVVVLMTSGTISAPPFISLSLAASGSKLEFHMLLTAPRSGCLRCTTWLTVATLASDWEKRAIQDPPRTTGTDKQQTSETLVVDDSTKRGIQCRVAETLSRTGPELCAFQIRQQRRLLFQPHLPSQCQILGGLARPDRNSNLANTSGARGADQTLRLFEQSPITALCYTWF